MFKKSQKPLHFNKNDKIVMEGYAFKVKLWDKESGRLNLKFIGVVRNAPEAEKTAS